MDITNRCGIIRKHRNKLEKNKTKKQDKQNYEPGTTFPPPHPSAAKGPNEEGE